jgi:threonine/homoserine/homoserine lactone efflux protein
MNIVYELFTILVFVFSPIVFSPGPANITLAGLGGTFSFKETYKFLIGLWITTFGGLVLCQLGIAKFISQYDVLVKGLPLFGASYLFYLSYLGIKNRKNVEVKTLRKVPSVLEGILFQAMNPKFIVVCMSVYSPFVDRSTAFLSSFTVVFFIASACAHLLWFTIGRKLASVLGGKKAQIVFSAMLAIVGLWMLSTVLLQF